MVWYGMVWYGMVWYGMVWYGMVWYSLPLIPGSQQTLDLQESYKPYLCRHCRPSLDSAVV
jgi:hypothetical protein